MTNMEIGFFIADITDKEAGDIAQEIAELLKEWGHTVTDYFIEVQG